MAITINQEPMMYSPASNELLWAFSSDNTGQPNFSYKVKLYIEGALFGTYELYPMAGPFCKFDASEYLRSFVRTQMTALGGFTWVSQDQAVSTQIYVYESYGTPPEIQAESETRSHGNYAFNGALRYEQFNAFNSSLYWLDYSNALQPQMMTYYPASVPQFTPYKDPFLVGVFARRDHEYYELELNIFDAAGTVTYGYTGLIDMNFIVNMIDISPGSMDNMGWTSGIEWDTCYYYEVTLIATSDGLPYTTQSTVPFRLYLDRDCIRFDHQRLYWVNKFGVIDQYSFNKLRIDSSNVQNFGYQVQRGSWVDGFYNLGLNDAEKKSAMKTAEDKIVLNSDWMKPAVQNWLVRELYESPQVWMYEQGVFKPVVVENNQNVLKSRFKDGLIQETVNITVTWSYRSQLN
jgi:hypothetical protein